MSAWEVIEPGHHASLLGRVMRQTASRDSDWRAEPNGAKPKNGFRSARLAREYVDARGRRPPSLLSKAIRAAEPKVQPSGHAWLFNKSEKRKSR